MSQSLMPMRSGATAATARIPTVEKIEEKTPKHGGETDTVVFGFPELYDVSLPRQNKEK